MGELQLNMLLAFAQWERCDPRGGLRGRRRPGRSLAASTSPAPCRSGTCGRSRGAPSARSTRRRRAAIRAAFVLARRPGRALGDVAGCLDRAAAWRGPSGRGGGWNRGTPSPGCSGTPPTSVEARQRRLHRLPGGASAGRLAARRSTRCRRSGIRVRPEAGCVTCSPVSPAAVRAATRWAGRSLRRLHLLPVREPGRLRGRARP